MPPPKVAIVTGTGRRRVGWYIANALAEKGFAVVVHYRTSATEATELVDAIRKRGGQASAAQADLSHEDQVKGLIQAAVSSFGRIDLLVNTAAFYKSKKLEEVTADDLRRHFEVNILATFLCSQQAGLVMVKQPEGGCIVNFSDWTEARPYLDYSAYLATKGGVPALTRCLAVELGTRNPKVRVNAIAPGPILYPADMGAAERNESIEATLVKHQGSPENIIQAVLFLAENDFVTGTCVTVDGGRTVYAGGM
jgi:pteridine reductase